MISRADIQHFSDYECFLCPVAHKMNTFLKMCYFDMRMIATSVSGISFSLHFFLSP